MFSIKKIKTKLYFSEQIKKNIAKQIESLLNNPDNIIDTNDIIPFDDNESLALIEDCKLSKYQSIYIEKTNKR